MELRWAERDGDVVLLVRGLPAGEPRVLPADVLDDGRPPAARRSMAGRWDVHDGEAVFTPRFPFLPGTAYAVAVGPIATVLRRPAVTGPRRTHVVAVEPGGDDVPRNLLRFSVRFSHPMSEGRAARCVRLERVASGDAIPGAFLAMDPELWDAGHRRLTVLLDPARIKRGLLPHREAGYPLAEGDEVRLVVDDGFCDAEGRPLRGGASATFRVGPDLRGRVRPDEWRMSVPPAGTREPLQLSFGRPLDRVLAERCLRAVDVAGRGTVDDDGRAWRFVPDGPWPPGPVRVLVDPALEDVAGNSVVRVFDRDLQLPADDPIAPVDVPVLTAEIRSA